MTSRYVTSSYRRITTFVRLRRNSVRRYSNEIRITSFVRPFQAQRNDPRYVSVASMKRKLRAFEILDIYAWVHYTCG